MRKCRTNKYIEKQKYSCRFPSKWENSNFSQQNWAVSIPDGDIYVRIPLCVLLFAKKIKIRRVKNENTDKL